MLETVLALATSMDPEPHLIEVGRALSTGGDARLFVWSSGPLCAATLNDRVRIQPCAGDFLDSERGLDLSRDELAWLARACREWSSRRGRWAALSATRSAPHALARTRYWYEQRGRAPREIEREDAERAREVVRRRRERIESDLHLTAELVLVGVPGVDRARVGARFAGASLRLDAHRDRALVWRRTRSRGLTLHEGAERFVEVLDRL